MANRHPEALRNQCLEYMKDHSVVDTEKKFGISNKTLFHWKRDKNMKPKYKVYSPEEREEIVAYAKAQGRPAAIDRFKVAPGTLVSWFAKNDKKEEEPLFTAPKKPRKKSMPKYFPMDIEEKLVKEEPKKSSKVTLIVCEDANAAIDVLKGVFNT